VYANFNFNFNLDSLHRCGGVETGHPMRPPARRDRAENNSRNLRARKYRQENAMKGLEGKIWEKKTSL
jgi:hypothetical protein